MGRARKKGATFYALLPENDYFKLSEKLTLFQEINQSIILHLKRNVEKIDADLHTIKNSWQADVIPPICPGGLPDSPKITMDSAYDVVERYCNLLPSDGIATLQTMSWWSDDQHILGQYKAYLKLPLNGALKQTVEV